MGRSQETFSKKEKEKKKLKKRKDKEAKREERKANVSSGKLEDMIAYVDEFGNIVDTPPEQQTRSEVNADDIVLGVPKQEAPDPADLIRKGTVSFFNESKGYGFIKDHVSQESVFVHANKLTEPIGEGDKVTFEVEMGPKGPSAFNVKLV
jgi:cold shock CspA family protein